VGAFYLGAFYLGAEATRPGDEDGGYTWARYGFVPEDASWNELRGEIAGRLHEIQGLPDDVRQSLEELLASSNSKAIWRIADSRTPVPISNESSQLTTLGKRLLRGTTWKGYMDVKDPVVNRRFDSYVKNRPKW
jgi:hypothetical protein